MPTVIVTSRDDPFVAAERTETVVEGTGVALHVEPVGGHIGYLSAERTPVGTRRWIDAAVWHYVSQWV